MSTTDNERRKSRLTPQDARKGGQGGISKDDPTLELDESGGRRATTLKNPKEGSRAIR